MMSMTRLRLVMAAALAALGVTPLQAQAGETLPSSRQDMTVRIRADIPPYAADHLIREGHKQMRAGDILAARQLYERSMVYGYPETYLAMGRSYDPFYFARLNIKSGEPDSAKAMEWYQKALDAGLSGAQMRIDAMRRWLER
jgi:TPR repeat protein